MELNFTNPLIYGVPCFVLFIIAELIYSHKKGDKHIYDKKDLTASTAMGLGAVLLAPLLKVISAGAIFHLIFELFAPVRASFGYEHFGFAWYTWLICQFLDDFCYYWFHRANHEVRIFWAAHIVHHSSEKFNFGTGIRNGWFTIMYKPLFYMWLPAIGFHPAMVLVCLGIEALWQFQLHSQYIPKLGFLEKFLNLHTQHQVHHAQNVEYLDKNHGGYLNIFDRMFGTYKELDEENIDTKYGVIHAPNSYNPLVILTHEYKDIWKDVKNAKNLKEAFMYVFGPPGWSPDGSTLTVKQVQRQLKEEKKKAKEAAENMTEEVKNTAEESAPAQQVAAKA